MARVRRYEEKALAVQSRNRRSGRLHHLNASQLRRYALYETLFYKLRLPSAVPLPASHDRTDLWCWSTAEEAHLGPRLARMDPLIAK